MHQGPCLIFYRDYFIQSSHSWHNYRLCSILQMRKWRVKTFSICLVSGPAGWVESRILPATLYYQWFWWGVLLASNKTSSNCLKKKKVVGKGVHRIQEAGRTGLGNRQEPRASGGQATGTPYPSCHHLCFCYTTPSRNDNWTSGWPHELPQTLLLHLHLGVHRPGWEGPRPGVGSPVPYSRGWGEWDSNCLASTVESEVLYPKITRDEEFP